MDSNPSDEQLLSAYLGGDRAALGELAHRYEPPLLGLAGGLLGASSSMACDAVQETWMRVIRYGHSFNGSSSLKTWLYRIAINRCRDLAAKEKGRGVGRAVRDQAPEGNGPDECSIRRERNEALRDAVGQLTPPKREILLLCYHEAMTHEQAAEVLEIPVGTLKSRLHTALSELRDQLTRKAEP
ncbi:MAG: RNA polymerase sigma factor [Planctomycetota bacterium]|jgi:RNA polymerase sigma-70 factor (ECF subfamily)